MRLKDKVAIVTGAANGIGAEISRTFARRAAMWFWQILTRARQPPWRRRL